MSANKNKVIIFDLDETLGYFSELGIFCDVLENYTKQKMSFDTFYLIMNMFPEFQRPNIINILSYLKEKKQKGSIYKVYLYTNNQGPKEWAENICKYFERKINYNLFDKIIGAYKINGKIIETTRTTNDKTLSDFLQSTKLQKKTSICFIDDLYHPYMDDESVYYIKVDPYVFFIPFTTMAERYYKRMNLYKILPNKSEFINYITSYMNKYNINKITKTTIDIKKDIFASKDLMEHLRKFVKIIKSKSKSKSKSKNIKNNRQTRKKISSNNI